MSTNQLLEPTKEALDINSNTAEYVKSVLDKREANDKEGLLRPVYLINGREVAFRNRQETPEYDDSEVVVLGGPSVYPIERQVWDDKTMAYKLSDESKVRDYVDRYSADAPRMIVTNTPEGILAAASVLVASDDESRRLKALADSFAGRKEWSEEHKDAIDTILSSVSINDDESLSGYLETDGWAVALAALTGDATAQEIIERKKQSLYKNERERASDPDRADRMREHEMEYYGKEIEPIPLEQMAFVHSTSYDINLNANNEVVLRSAGQWREDRFARATLHGTLNSQVGDVYANGVKQEWSDENKVIVTNLKKVIDRNQKLPNRMDGMDTEFVLNPGEELALPDALIISRVEQTSNGTVIEEDESGVKYVKKDKYSIEETQQLRALSQIYGTSEPKELALRIAMHRVGVPVDLMDLPSSDGHGMWSQDLARRVASTASGLGLTTGAHFGTPEDRLESDTFYNLSRVSNKINDASEAALRTEGMSAYQSASLEARRQALASGFYPARPNTPTEHALSFDSSWNGI